MNSSERAIAKVIEAAKYVVLTGEGITDLDIAISEYEELTEIPEIVVDSYEDDNEVGC